MPVKEDRPVGRDAVQRRPRIQVEVQVWDWSKGRLSETWYLETFVQSITWNKTIKSPAGTCQIELFPQMADSHFFERFNTLDVIRVLEFDTLKWQGYVKRVAFSGYIDPAGNPHRNVTIHATSFGGYLLEPKASIDISILENDSDFFGDAVKLAEDLEAAGEGGLTFAESVSTVVNAWFSFLDSAIGNNKQTKYVQSFADLSTGLSGNAAPGLPKEVFLFYGNEEEVNLWQVIQKLAEIPFNEFFFDEGPRKVWVDGKTVDLPRDKTYLIGRETPFDDSLNNSTGVVEKRFQAMPSVKIPISHLTRFDFNKSMEEVYSVHIVSPAIIDFSKLDLLAIGSYAKDDDNFEKYSYRPNQQQLFYMQIAKKDATEKEPDASKISNRAEWAATTLKNWYHNNDKFASGVISYMVPSDPDSDPRIGDKLEVEGIDAYFYVEGLTHSWTYGGKLEAQASVTRGWRKTGGEVKFANRIFKLPRQAFRKQDIS